MSRKLCVPRVPHNCRLCGGTIPKGEPCVKWACLIDGEGWRTAYAHPECLAETVRLRWDSGDWERNAPGDLRRPTHGN